MTDTQEARQARQAEFGALARRAVKTGLRHREIAKRIGHTEGTFKNNIHQSDQPPTQDTLERLKRLVDELEAKAAVPKPPAPTPEEIAALQAAKDEADQSLKAEFRALMDDNKITADEAADYLDRTVGMIYRWRGIGPAPSRDKIESLRKLVAQRKGAVYVPPKKGDPKGTRILAERRREETARKDEFKRLFGLLPGVSFKQVADGLNMRHSHMERLLWDGRSFPSSLEVEKMRLYVEVVGPELVAFEKEQLAEVRRQAKVDAQRMIEDMIADGKERAIREAVKQADTEWVVEVVASAKSRRKSEIVAVRKAAQALTAVIDRAKEDDEAKGAILHAWRKLDDALQSSKD